MNVERVAPPPVPVRQDAIIKLTYTEARYLLTLIRIPLIYHCSEQFFLDASRTDIQTFQMNLAKAMSKAGIVDTTVPCR